MTMKTAFVLLGVITFSGSALAELQFNSEMPWTTQDVESAAGASGGSGGSNEPAAPDAGAWVTFANAHCGTSYVDFAAYEADSGTLTCTFTDADVTTNFPDRSSTLGFQFTNSADVTNMDFMSTITSPTLIQITDDDGNLTDITGLGNLSTVETLYIGSGTGITDVSALDGVQVINEGSVTIHYGLTSATQIPAFASGSSFYSSGIAMVLCDGYSGCNSAGSLTDVSGLANVDPSVLSEGAIRLFNTNYAVKAPASSTFCTNWTTDVVWQTNFTPVTKSNVCAP